LKFMTYPESTFIMGEFSFYGEDFDPADITAELGIQPSRVRLKGEKYWTDERIIPPKTSWHLETGYQESLDIDTQLLQLTKVLVPKKDEIIKVQKQYSLYSIFCFVIWIIDGRTPALYLEREFLDFANDIGATNDFDTYSIPYLEDYRPKIGRKMRRPDKR